MKTYFFIVLAGLLACAIAGTVPIEDIFAGVGAQYGFVLI